MFRKFRNLDKMEILQNAVNCLTNDAERLKKKNENLESKLELTKNYWDKWQKDFEAEHKRIKGLLATREHEIEELNEKYLSETDLAKVKIFDLRKEVEKRTKQLMQAEQISDDRLLINKDLKEKIAKQNIQLNLKKEALNESQTEQGNLRKWNQISKEEIGKLQEQLEAAQIDATEWEDIAKERANEINKLIDRVAFLEDNEDGNVHAYLETIAKLKEQNKRLRKGMRK